MPLPLSLPSDSAITATSPLRPLNRLAPKRLLSRFSSLEPYLCLTYNFSALPPEHRLDGAQARSARSRTDGHEQNGALRPPHNRLHRPFLPPDFAARTAPAARRRSRPARSRRPVRGAVRSRRNRTTHRSPLRRLFAPPQNATKIPCGRMVSCAEGRTKKETARTRFSECAPSFGEKEEKRDENKSVRFPLSG